MGPLGPRDGQTGSGVLEASDHRQPFRALSLPCATHILILYVRHNGEQAGKQKESTTNF